jgi:K+-sensing histidine kinase KdpD
MGCGHVNMGHCVLKGFHNAYGNVNMGHWLLGEWEMHVESFKKGQVIISYNKDISQKERAIYIENISKSTNRIVEVVDILVGIKTINNIATYNFQALSIRTIVENSIIKYKNEIIKRGLNFQVSTFKDVPLLTNDLKKISFVFDTIIENAIFYTPKNGKILIDFISNHEKITIFIIISRCTT